jgi:hypothetical protein
MYTPHLCPDIVQRDLENEDGVWFLKQNSRVMFTAAVDEGASRSGSRTVYLMVAYAFWKAGCMRRKPCCGDTCIMNYTPMVDDTKSGILKHEADEAHRRLQQGFEVLRRAFPCNRKVYL